jgi:hypothetical protein
VAIAAPTAGSSVISSRRIIGTMPKCLYLSCVQAEGHQPVCDGSNRARSDRTHQSYPGSLCDLRHTNCRRTYLTMVRLFEKFS